MADAEKPGEDKQEAEAADSGITQPTAPPPQQPPPTLNAANAGDNPDPSKPIFVQLVGGEALEPVEEQTLAIARESRDISRDTYRVAVLAFLAAVAAAAFIAVQVREMS